MKNISNADEFAVNTVECLLILAQQLPPARFKAFLMGGILTNLFGHLSDEYWKEFLKCEPCGQPMCNCHLLAAQVTPVLDAMRRDWKEHAPKEGFSE